VSSERRLLEMDAVETALVNQLRAGSRRELSPR
jgi:hypothetical protein